MSRVFPLFPSINQKVTVGSKEFEWDGNFWKRVRVTESDITTSANSALTDANSYTDTAIANLVDTAPSTLNTLNELASALGDDPDFATTVTNQIAGKANNLHTHAISDVTNLQNELDGKSDTNHGHPISDVTNLQNELDDKFEKAGGTVSGDMTVASTNLRIEPLSGNAGLEIGQTAGASSSLSFIDFHTSANFVDYDARIIAENGNNVVAGAPIKIEAAKTYTVGAKDNSSQFRNITISSNAPSGGNIGDIWIQV